MRVTVAPLGTSPCLGVRVPGEVSGDMGDMGNEEWDGDGLPVPDGRRLRIYLDTKSMLPRSVKAASRFSRWPLVRGGSERLLGRSGDRVELLSPRWGSLGRVRAMVAEEKALPLAGDNLPTPAGDPQSSLGEPQWVSTPIADGGTGPEDILHSHVCRPSNDTYSHSTSLILHLKLEHTVMTSL